MNACKTPCNACPFRKNSLPGWLATYTPTELHSVVMSEKPFPCHLTHPTEELSWDESGTPEHPLCAGALMYMRKNAKNPRNPELSKLVRSIKLEDCDNILNTSEFIKHHSLVSNKKLKSIARI